MSTPEITEPTTHHPPAAHTATTPYSSPSAQTSPVANTQGETKGETTYRDIASFTRMSRPTRGAGASAAALAMCAMDPDDTEGAELPPVDAEEKNMTGDGKKRRVERTHDAPRHTGHTHDTEGAELPAVDAHPVNTQGETKGETTYVYGSDTRGREKPISIFS